MSQLSFSSFGAAVLVRDNHGHYAPATAHQILEAARQVVDQKMQRGASFSSPVTVKACLLAKLGGLEFEVFAAMFLDTRHRMVEYTEMLRGTEIRSRCTVLDQPSHDFGFARIWPLIASQR